MNYILILFYYFFKGITELKTANKKIENKECGGIILEIFTYKFKRKNLFYFQIHKTVDIYWKPLKMYISKESFKSSLEYNTHSASPYVAVWFKIELKNEYTLYSIRMLEQVYLGSSLTVILNNFSNNVQKIKI